MTYAERIEAIARAITGQETGDIDERWYRKARAADLACLKAIEGVDGASPAMLAAGKRALFSCSEDPELDDARKCWRAMHAAIPRG